MIEFNDKNIKRWMMAGMRNAFGMFLTELATENPRLKALTADFTKSTGLQRMHDELPDQYMSVGIAEQNMVSLASGLASEGYNVFACSFASFATTRCYEQIKINLGYMRHNVKMVGIASGVGVSYQGNTHFGLDDVSLMRAIPGMVIVVPCDCAEVAKATIALAEYDGPAYLRLVGEGWAPVINKTDYEFQIGKGIKLREGQDVLIIANGTMVNNSLKVAEKLAEDGIQSTIVNMHTVKPLDKDIINANIEGKKLIVSIEEAQVIGGLGSAVAEHLVTIPNVPRLLTLGVQDCFPHPGSYPYLLEQCGLSVEKILEKIKSNI